MHSNSNPNHIIVVGSGIAGLIAALELSRENAVTLVTKAALAESNTRWAQGGIAAAMFSDDSVADHIADTLTAGAGLCNPEAVNVLCAEGPDRIRDLIRLGVAFDHAADGQLARGLEAAHSYPRVLHAGGDATGLTIETALVRAVRAQPSISVLEHTFAKDLILSATGTVIGLEVLTELRGVPGPGSPASASARWGGGPASGTLVETHTLDADAVILASGGAGQLFLHTTNPSVATGDGVAIALRAGAQLADTEFYQFHPTALATTPSPDPSSSSPVQTLSSQPEAASFAAEAERPAVFPADAATSTFLISEAVRGEGAVLLDANGRRFMQPIHPSAELAPRDVVARGIAHQMAGQQGAPVLLDATGLIATHGPGFLATRFPSIDAATRARNLDWSRDPIPVTPAAHYWMGGVRTDLWGRTSVPGLYAVGEVACTGVHGANRLASNSLLESLVFAWRCAHLLLGDNANDARSRNPQTLSSRPEAERSEAAAERPAASTSDPTQTLSSRPEARFCAAVERPLYSANVSDASHPEHDSTPVTRHALQTLLWNNVGIERTRSGLEAAATQLNRWHAEGDTIHDLETANLLTLARVIVAAALAREESRGAHFRNDFPEPSPAFQHSLVYSTKPGPQTIQPQAAEPQQEPVSC